MASFADEVAQALDELQTQYGGFSMTYHRGAITINLTGVVKGKKLFRYTDTNGFATAIETADIFAKTAQMGGLEPRPGDRVTEEVSELVLTTNADGVVFGNFVPRWNETYEVTSINREKCWYWSDVGRSVMRIHTLLMKRELIPIV